MNKIIEINLIDPNFDDSIPYSDLYYVTPPRRPRLFAYECENIVNSVFEGKNKITNDDMQNALDVIAAYFVQEKIEKVILDIDKRNQWLEPAKEMTIEDIERKLGYKIKIINKERGANDN